MQNVIAIWSGLTLKRRIAVVGATLGVFLAVSLLALYTSAPRFVLLYGGLDGPSAGQVMQALDERGAVYEIRGDSIHVLAAERDALRMALAASGLPGQAIAGYELLDGMTGFSTTSQMFDVAYWRAKEGELARTIMAMPGMRAVRVHIAREGLDSFARSPKISASVMVTTLAGLSGEQALALRHLVASGVSGLTANNVEIIDSLSGLIGAQEDGKTTHVGAAQRRGAEIRQSVERLLAARVGAGNAIVEVAVELDLESEQVSERLIDPQRRALISSETEEVREQNNEGQSSVGVASNLPDGDEAAASSSQSSQTRERVNYEVSETNRAISREAGGLRRLTVAVLVDGQNSTSPEGVSIKTPRSEEELAALRELVGSAVGLNEQRGDVLTLKSMDFLPVPTLGSPPPVSSLGASVMEHVDLMQIFQIVALALVSVILGLFVIRPALMERELPPPEVEPLTLPMAQAPSLAMMMGEVSDVESDFSPTSLGSLSEEAPNHRLRRLIGERQSETIEILRNWLEPEEEKA